MVLSALLLEVSNQPARSTWGVNDVMLTCRDSDTDEEVANAIFTRNGDAISTSTDGNCSPSSAYCVDQEYTSQLSFTASNEAERKFACKKTTLMANHRMRLLFLVSAYVLKYW